MLVISLMRDMLCSDRLYSLTQEIPAFRLYLHLNIHTDALVGNHGIVTEL